MTHGKHDSIDGPRPKAVLVAVQLPGTSDIDHEADVAELGRLVDTLGLEVIGKVEQKRSHLATGGVLGAGKLMELALWTGGTGVIPKGAAEKKDKARLRREEEEGGDDDDLDDIEAAHEGDDDDAPFDDEPKGRAAIEAPSVHADVVVVDHEISPRQARNLEQATGAEVLDRSSVIVEIFNRHAKSREARLQVELARLMYVAPRLRASGGGADRQRGGVGGKGAGESAVELDRRKIRDRIAQLREELESVQSQQATRRARRKDARRVALVGYTNAGKSSLMRRLTGSGVYVADKLFATLDTTVRLLDPPSDPPTLVGDTVGFIKKLPHQLVASFRSTLDEALEASWLLHLADASDPTFRSQLEVTREVLADIGADVVPYKLVLNKADRLSPEQQAELAAEFPDAMIVSAHRDEDVARVREAILAFFDGDLEEREIFVPYARHGAVGAMHSSARVMAERHEAEGTFVRVRAPRGVLGRLEALAAGDA
jgi:GTP-binding protein HflX